MPDPQVLTQVEDGVMLVTLNNADAMNAMTADMMTLLTDAIADANADDDVNALVLTGAGGTFCAGAEISGTGRLRAANPLPTRQERLDRRGWPGAITLAFLESDVPIIGAINGVAAGGGFGLALLCDVRFMADTASMGSIFIKRGLASDFAAAYLLPRIVGLGRAHELMYDGDPISAERCIEMGLADRVLAADQLLDEACAYAQKIASGPSLAYSATRRMLQRSSELQFIHFLEYEWTTHLGLSSSRDSREAFQAFAEHRDPRLQGL